MPLLFEFGKWESIENKDALKQMLINIWQQGLFVDNSLEINEEEIDSRFQPFLKFDNKQVRAQNYVGFIQNDKEVIEIYPKVFRNIGNPTDQKCLMLRHIFYWFDYCHKWRFPFNQANLDKVDIKDFPELIMNLIATQFLDTISNQPLTMYQTVEDAFQSPRGSINFKRYVNNGITRGNTHIIDCDYEPFQYDNKVNRIIKYCARLLLNLTRLYENQRVLQEVIFVLDEVDDLPCTVHDIESAGFNYLFDDYSFLMNSCHLILSQQLYTNNIYSLSQWCLLFPMEYIFEDFFAGFLQDKFHDQWRVEYQKSDRYLAINEFGKNIFNMQHDIFLTSRENSNLKIIVDTKYKIRDANFKNDSKKGISQNDLYQMVSYAFKRGCPEVLLVYPNITENINDADKFEIESGYFGHEKITVTAIEIPFWSMTDFNSLPNKLESIISEILKSFELTI